MIGQAISSHLSDACHSVFVPTRKHELNWHPYQFHLDSGKEVGKSPFQDKDKKKAKKRALLAQQLPTSNPTALWSPTRKEP